MAELKIVIAEDNPLMMELLSSILEEEDGFVVVGKADNGEDAYQMIMEKGPDLVLLDVIMPKLDGISVLEKVRAAREPSGYRRQRAIRKQSNGLWGPENG